MLGSHLDTVRTAGKYDGMLGVVSAIECVNSIAAHEAVAGRRLPFAIEVIGFADEEGVRFGVTLLGSRAVAGTFDRGALQATDRDGTTLADAMRRFGLDPAGVGAAARRRDELLAYAELHIEQGPVLEAEGLPVGIVTAINGFSRMRVTVAGITGHAGTVPMALRRDALAAAAECVLAVERVGRSEADLVATVGVIEAPHGAINVIPGAARFTIDVRAPSDDQRRRAVARIEAEFAAIRARRGVELEIERVQDADGAPCAYWLTRQLERAVAGEGVRVKRLASGAGHDGMAMQAIADIAMLFVRCERGVSHDPAEAVTAADIATGARVLLRFIEELSFQQAPGSAVRRFRRVAAMIPPPRQHQTGYHGAMLTAIALAACGGAHPGPEGSGHSTVTNADPGQLAVSGDTATLTLTGVKSVSPQTCGDLVSFATEDSGTRVDERQGQPRAARVRPRPLAPPRPAPQEAVATGPGPADKRFPGSLKSRLVMVLFPAWMWLHDPTFTIATSSTRPASGGTAPAATG